MQFLLRCSITKEFEVADQNDRLNRMRELSSALKGATHPDPELVTEFADLFIKFDIEAMDGKLPDSWSLEKFSKSRAETVETCDSTSKEGTSCRRLIHGDNSHFGVRDDMLVGWREENGPEYRLDPPAMA